MTNTTLMIYQVIEAINNEQINNKRLVAHDGDVTAEHCVM